METGDFFECVGFVYVCSLCRYMLCFCHSNVDLKFMFIEEQ